MAFIRRHLTLKRRKERSTLQGRVAVLRLIIAADGSEFRKNIRFYSLRLQVLTCEFEKNLAEQGLLSTKSHKLYEQRLKSDKAELKAVRKATQAGAKDPYSA